MNGWWIFVIVSAVVLIVGIVLIYGGCVLSWGWGCVEVVGMIITILSGLCFIAFTLIAINSPLNGKREYEVF